jgi:hypothetical protein
MVPWPELVPDCAALSADANAPPFDFALDDFAAEDA